MNDAELEGTGEILRSVLAVAALLVLCAIPATPGEGWDDDEVDSHADEIDERDDRRDGVKVEEGGWADGRVLARDEERRGNDGRDERSYSVEAVCN